MGLTAKIELDTGMVIDAAYIRVESIRGDKTRIDATTGVYVNGEAAETGKPAVQQLHVSFTPSFAKRAPDLWEQAYAELKRHPQIAQFVDELAIEKPPEVARRPVADWLQKAITP